MGEDKKSFEQLEEQEAQWRNTLRRHLENGVNFLSITGVYIEDSVTIEPGATILPGTFLRGETRVGTGSTIGPNAVLNDAEVGCDVTFNASQGYGCSIGDGARIGPFVHIRPGSRIGAGVKIGDFVEVKNSVIGEGTSIAHLTYVGDSDVGRHCNFGCGVVTVNYDGVSKSRTEIGDYAFIGCNSNLVAPVRIGEGAYTAAGSTLTKDVPPGALGIARAKQVNREGWAEAKLKSYKEKHSK